MNLAFFPVDRGIIKNEEKLHPFVVQMYVTSQESFLVEVPQFYNQSEQVLNRHSNKH